MDNKKTINSHSSKSSNNPVYSLCQYNCSHENTYNDGYTKITESSGDALSVDYYLYKYVNFDKVDTDNLAQHIFNALKSIDVVNNCDCISSIPSACNIKLQRIIRKVAIYLDIPYVDILVKKAYIKIKETDISNRKELSDIYTCNESIVSGNNLLLLDDFVESGTTFKQCEQVIKETYPNLNIHKIAIFRTHNTPEELE